MISAVSQCKLKVWEQGVGEGVQQIKSKDGIPFQKMGVTWVFNEQVFLDFSLPTGSQLVKSSERCGGG